MAIHNENNKTRTVDSKPENQTGMTNKIDRIIDGVVYQVPKHDFNEVVNEISNLRKSGTPHVFHLIDTLKRGSLSKTLVALYMSNPARMQEIKEHSYSSNSTRYSDIHKLREVKLLKLVPIADLWNRTDLDKTEKLIMNKFNSWTKEMSDKRRNYYVGKTNYFVLTDLAKDPVLLNWLLQKERSEWRTK
jgi:hypothetical protein